MPTRTYHIPYAMPTRTYHIPCHVHNAIPYIMSRTPDNDMPARPYHIPCHALPDHAVYHVMHRQTIPYTMLCPPGHTIYHAMPTRPYHIPCHARQAIPYTMSCIVRPYHILCHARQAIPFSMPCPTGHTIYHAMPIRPYHI